jgi:hypothetical protein
MFGSGTRDDLAAKLDVARCYERNYSLRLPQGSRGLFLLTPKLPGSGYGINRR